jgi:hypothetical protein
VATVPVVAVVPDPLPAGNADPGEAVGDGVDVVGVTVSDAEVMTDVGDVMADGVGVDAEVEVPVDEETLSVLLPSVGWDEGVGLPVGREELLSVVAGTGEGVAGGGVSVEGGPFVGELTEAGAVVDVARVAVGEGAVEAEVEGVTEGVPVEGALLVGELTGAGAVVDVAGVAVGEDAVEAEVEEVAPGFPPGICPPPTSNSRKHFLTSSTAGCPLRSVIGVRVISHVSVTGPSAVIVVWTVWRVVATLCVASCLARMGNAWVELVHENR